MEIALSPDERSGCWLAISGPTSILACESALTSSKKSTAISLTSPAHSKGWEWSIFCDSVKVRGLSDALKLLPVERWTKYRKHLAAHPRPWGTRKRFGRFGHRMR